jgi:hypothetical protein
MILEDFGILGFLDFGILGFWDFGIFLYFMSLFNFKNFRDFVISFDFRTLPEKI